MSSYTLVTSNPSNPQPRAQPYYPAPHAPKGAFSVPPSENPVRCKLCNHEATLNPIWKYDLLKHRQLQQQQDYHGIIAKLPPTNCVPQGSSCWNQDGLNVGAYNHPVVIVWTSDCGHLVFCAPITSFGKTSVESKYQTARRDRRACEEYIPLARYDARRINHKGILRHSGPDMKEQSSVHLDYGFWIEPEYLGEWSEFRRLDKSSLEWLRTKYRQEEQHWLVNERRLKVAKDPLKGAIATGPGICVIPDAGGPPQPTLAPPTQQSAATPWSGSNAGQGMVHALPPRPQQSAAPPPTQTAQSRAPQPTHYAQSRAAPYPMLGHSRSTAQQHQSRYQQSNYASRNRPYRSSNTGNSHRPNNTGDSYHPIYSGDSYPSNYSGDFYRPSNTDSNSSRSHDSQQQSYTSHSSGSYVPQRWSQAYNSQYSNRANQPWLNNQSWRHPIET